ncbi:hypothetical protein QBC38DRAFT_485722 [Podospora fimiseda]|uniref:Uncharacterized protein n=1 Tax=Podospora fimiseda TaxID=252190 RepID=A0AAN7BJC5_9PEZI|nr:hypothetical protein QBC38DRAFT_485722 [Podospora fimiseda]
MPTSIPLTHTPPNHLYKLVELPSDLLTLLESENPPTLKITFSAVLVTPKSSYSLRQKNTSNALILLGLKEEGEVTTLGTLHETVELVPMVVQAGDDDQSSVAAQAPKVVKGKWHEKFGRGRK